MQDYLAGPDHHTQNWISDPGDKKAAEKQGVGVASSLLGEVSIFSRGRVFAIWRRVQMPAVGHPAGSWVGPYFSRRVMQIGNGRAYQVTLGEHTK